MTNFGERVLSSPTDMSDGDRYVIPGASSEELPASPFTNAFTNAIPVRATTQRPSFLAAETFRGANQPIFTGTHPTFQNEERKQIATPTSTPRRYSPGVVRSRSQMGYPSILPNDNIVSESSVPGGTQQTNDGSSFAASGDNGGCMPVPIPKIPTDIQSLMDRVRALQSKTNNSAFSPIIKTPPVDIQVPGMTNTPGVAQKSISDSIRSNETDKMGCFRGFAETAMIVYQEECLNTKSVKRCDDDQFFMDIQANPTFTSLEYSRFSEHETEGETTVDEDSGRPRKNRSRSNNADISSLSDHSRSRNHQKYRDNPDLNNRLAIEDTIRSARNAVRYPEAVKIMYDENNVPNALTEQSTDDSENEIETVDFDEAPNSNPPLEIVASGDDSNAMRDLRLQLFQKDNKERVVPEAQLSRALGELEMQDKIIDSLQTKFEEVTSADLETKLERERERTGKLKVKVAELALQASFLQAELDKAKEQSKVTQKVVDTSTISSDIANAQLEDEIESSNALRKRLQEFTIETAHLKSELQKTKSKSSREIKALKEQNEDLLAKHQIIMAKSRIPSPSLDRQHNSSTVKSLRLEVIDLKNQLEEARCDLLKKPKKYEERFESNVELRAKLLRAEQQLEDAKRAVKIERFNDNDSVRSIKSNSSSYAVEKKLEEEHEKYRARTEEELRTARLTETMLRNELRTLREQRVKQNADNKAAEVETIRAKAEEDMHVAKLTQTKLREEVRSLKEINVKNTTEQNRLQTLLAGADREAKEARELATMEVQMSRDEVTLLREELAVLKKEREESSSNNLATDNKEKTERIVHLEKELKECREKEKSMKEVMDDIAERYVKGEEDTKKALSYIAELTAKIAAKEKEAQSRNSDITSQENILRSDIAALKDLNLKCESELRNTKFEKDAEIEKLKKSEQMLLLQIEELKKQNMDYETKSPKMIKSLNERTGNDNGSSLSVESSKEGEDCEAGDLVLKAEVEILRSRLKKSEEERLMLKRLSSKDSLALTSQGTVSGNASVRMLTDVPSEASSYEKNIRQPLQSYKATEESEAKNINNVTPPTTPPRSITSQQPSSHESTLSQPSSPMRPRAIATAIAAARRSVSPLGSPPRQIGGLNPSPGSPISRAIESAQRSLTPPARAEFFLKAPVGQNDINSLPPGPLQQRNTEGMPPRSPTRNTNTGMNAPENVSRSNQPIVVQLARPMGILFEEDEDVGGIRIDDIVSSGNAARLLQMNGNTVQIGDTLASINGISALNMTVEELEDLVTSTEEEIVLELLRHPTGPSSKMQTPLPQSGHLNLVTPPRSTALHSPSHQSPASVLATAIMKKPPVSSSTPNKGLLTPATQPNESMESINDDDTSTSSPLQADPIWVEENDGDDEAEETIFARNLHNLPPRPERFSQRAHSFFGSSPTDEKHDDATFGRQPSDEFGLI